MTPLTGQHGPEGHGSRAFEPNDTRGAVGVHRPDTEVFAHRFEFGEASGARHAEWADPGENGKTVSVHGDSDAACDHQKAERHKEAGSDEEWEPEEGHWQIEMPFDDLGAVDAEHGTTGPDAGERDEKQCAPAAGAGSGGETVGQWGVPGAGGRRVEIDRS